MDIRKIFSFFDQKKYQQTKQKLMQQFEKLQYRIKKDKEYEKVRFTPVKDCEHLLHLVSFLLETVKHPNFKNLGYRGLQEKRSVLNTLLNQLFASSKGNSQLDQNNQKGKKIW